MGVGSLASRRRGQRQALYLGICAGLALIALAGGAPVESRAAVDTCPNAVFRVGPAAQLPGCRAYEQVSPVDKNGGDVFLGNGVHSTAVDGSKTIFGSFAEFAGAPSGGSTSTTEYLVGRTPDGWTTVPMLPPADPPAAVGGVIFSTPLLTVSLLRSSGLLESDPPAADGASNVYWRNNASHVVSPYLEMDGGFEFPVASSDFEHVAFANSEQLTTDPGLPSSFVSKVYERVDSGLRLVSFRPDGTPFQQDTRPAGASVNSSISYSTVGGISDDGRHAFFSTFDGLDPVDVYRRSDGTTTTLATGSRRAPADPEGSRPKQFKFASTDGSRVFFTSAELLTDDANTGPGPMRPGSDLYRYDFDADELTDVSATAGGDGAQVEGVVGFDEAGEHVYYVARGVVTDPPGPGGPIDGEPNLYLWVDDGTTSGSTRYIATLAASDSSNWFRLDGDWTARATADGRYLAFRSVANILGGAGGAGAQVYRYDADALAGLGDLVCVSCNPNGEPPAGPSSVPVHIGGLSAQRWELSRFLSEDGSRVFFSSGDQLAPRDGNSAVDAYMWEDGTVSLLSTGRSSTDSWFYNASASGDDAFVLTGEPLVAQDKDDLVDLYDARVGGGFPPPAPRSDCVDDSCQGAGSSLPASGDPGSTAFAGRGDVEPGPRQVLRVKRLSRGQLRALARGKAIRLRVRVARAATVRAVVRTRRYGFIAAGRARATGPGSVTVRLRLSVTARRALARRSVLHATLTVRATGARPKTLALRLRNGR
jgi:hypothetical protein